jgi:hypothetical protein
LEAEATRELGAPVLAVTILYNHRWTQMHTDKDGS